MEKAGCYLAALSGALTLPKLKSYFKRKDGFVVAYRGTDVKITFSWREVIDMADDVCFFGEPRGAARDYSRLFCSVFSRPYAQQIYYDIRRETAGDLFASYALSNVFLTCMMNVYKKAVETQSVPMLTFYESDDSGGFYTLLDRVCRQSVFDSV